MINSFKKINSLKSLLTRGVIAVVAAASFLVAPVCANEIPDLDPKKFKAFVDARLGNRVKGYAFTLVAPGKTVVDGAGGYAQDPANGNVPMSTSIVSNIGSVSNASRRSVKDALADKQAAEIGSRGYWVARSFGRSNSDTKRSVRQVPPFNVLAKKRQLCKTE